MERIISLAENFENTKSAQDHAEIPVFAAIADENNQVLSVAGNAVESTKCVWFHAEFLAISRAIEIVQSKYLDNCSIYVTLEPCSFCASMIEKTRIKNIYFGAYNPKYGAIYHNANLFNYAQSKPNIIGGIQEERCMSIMTNFFQKLRMD